MSVDCIFCSLAIFLRPFLVMAATDIERPKLIGNRPLKEVDPTMFGLIEEEKSRQLRCIELIASKKFYLQSCSGVLGLGAHEQVF